MSGAATGDWFLWVLIGAVGLGLFLLGWALYLDATTWEPQRMREHTAACAAKGLKPASHTEKHGKTSSTARFCVDTEGRVYWPQ